MTKILDLIKMPEDVKEYTDNPNETNGIYSHTDEGKRWYDLEFNQGYNQALNDIRKLNENREVVVDKEEAMGCIAKPYGTDFKIYLSKILDSVKELTKSNPITVIEVENE